MSSPCSRLTRALRRPSIVVVTRCLLGSFALAEVLLGPSAMARAQVCGDAQLDSGEECEAPFDACCNPTTCLFEPGTVVCRTGSGDLCDPDESCSGFSAACPADTVSSASTVCRAGSGDLCDPDEACTGAAGAACPADTVSPASTVCRAGSGDLCDPDETCTGAAGDACPSDTVSPATTVCRPSAGDPHGSGTTCDFEELCTGGPGEQCPADLFEPSATICRAGSGDVCDPDETCPGTPGGVCPADTIEPTTTICRVGAGDPNASGFVCDPDEACTGNPGEACPTDWFSAEGFVCNPGSGDPNGSGVVCDPDEVCPGGAGGVCPADTFSDADTVCRAGAGSFDGEAFTCNATELCPGTADAACPIDVNYPASAGVVLRATGDTRIMETHRSSNNGGTGLIWIKRSPNSRGIVGFDLSCQGTATETIDCGLLEMSVHDGLPTLDGAAFAAHRLEGAWAEGNQAFDDFKWAGRKLGPFAGTGHGTTWGCRIDFDLSKGGSHDCDETDRWWGGEICGAGSCFAPATAVAPYLSTLQESLAWEVTQDVVGNPAPVGWLMKVSDEEDGGGGSVKVYQRDGARFVAESDPTTPAHVAFDLAPRLLLFGPEVAAPYPVLAEPVSRTSLSEEIQVSVDQVGGGLGDPARWENKTLGTWGYMDPGLLFDWSATIPLLPGANEVEFTVLDPCGTEGQVTYTLNSSADGEFCGDGVVTGDEECDDGNGVSGDCCSAACQIEADGSVCDDGDVCTSVSSCLAGACTGQLLAPSACGDSYLCYRGAVSREGARFLPVRDFSLVDPLGAASVDLVRPDHICLPGSVEGEPILDSTAHFVGYRMRENTKRSLSGGVQVTDRFGTISVDLLRADRLLLSAGMKLGSPPEAVGPGIIDHHLCYSVRMSVGKYPKGVHAGLADAFENRSYVLRKPSHLCLAAGTGAAGAVNSDAHLMCYRANRAPGAPKHEKRKDQVHTVDEVGDLRLDTRAEGMLCVPATIQ